MIGVRVHYRVKAVVRDAGSYPLSIRHVANMDGWCESETPRSKDVRCSCQFSFPILSIDQGCPGS